ncbi:MAG: bile acid:sodium symporter family protein [Negativicutes bacterium]|nr:bile acid:sodium symporter family protein [Negativicutes bacterium]
MIEGLGRATGFITKYFSVWIAAGVVLAYLHPEPVKPLAQFVPLCIMVVMLGMGLTVRLADFKLVLSRPADVFWGIFLRYLIMPAVAFAIAKGLALPLPLAIGLILVGSCPSGVASNVMTYLAKGDTALSVTVSSLNTLLSPLLTPLIFVFLAGTMIHIDAAALLVNILEIILVPVALGVFLRAVASDFVDRFIAVVPLFAVIGILIATCVGVALGAPKLATVAVAAFLAVAAHNGAGLFLGYWAARGVGMPPAKAKAISFEIGMENGGLAMALAIINFEPLVAIPAVIFNVWHNLTGPALASYWRSQADKGQKG